MDVQQETLPDTQNSDVGSLGTGAGTALIGRLLGRGLHVLTLVFLARWLGAVAFGLYALGLTILRMLGLLATLGLEQGVIRFAPHYAKGDSPNLGRLFSRALVLALAAGALLSVCLYFSAPWLSSTVFHNVRLMLVFRWFSLAFPLISGLAVASAITRVSKRMEFSVSSYELGQPAVNVLILLVSFLLGLRLFGAVIALVASFAVGLVLALYYVQKLYPQTFVLGKSAFPDSRALLAYSIPTCLTGGLSMMTIWVDRLVVAHFRPPVEVGIYQAVSQISVLFVIILSAFDAILGPMISSLHATNQNARIGEIFRISTKWVLYLSIPLFLFVCLDARGILSTLFGRVYGAGWVALLILLSGQMVNALTGNTGILLVVTGNQNFVLWSCAAMVFLNTALGFVLTPRWGMAGAAISTAVALISLNAVLLAGVRTRLNLWPYDMRYRKGVLASAVTVVAAIALRRVTIPSPPLNLFVRLAAITLVWVGALLIQGLDPEDKAFIKLMSGRFQSILASFTQQDARQTTVAAVSPSEALAPTSHRFSETSLEKVKVLYIAGEGRSGSTILGSILGQVEGFAHVGELRQLWKALLTPGVACGCGAPLLECDKWKAVLIEAYGNQWRDVAERMVHLRDYDKRPANVPIALAPGGDRYVRSRYRGPIEELGRLYRAIQDIFECDVIVDSSKSSLYGYHLNLTGEIESYVLHLIRDPRAVAYSWRRKKVQLQRDLPLAQRKLTRTSLSWTFWNLAIESFSRKGWHHQLRVPYEDFVCQPRAFLVDILRVVGTPASRAPQIIDGKMEIRPSHTVVGNPVRFRVGSVEIRADDEWKSAMTWQDRYVVAAFTWPLLLRYGYSGNGSE